MCRELKTCCDPAGSQANQGQRQTGVRILARTIRRATASTLADHSNAPDVRLAMIEELARAMRQRTSTGEAFGVDKNALAARVAAARVAAGVLQRWPRERVCVV
jgi:hypothetical protein